MNWRKPRNVGEWLLLLLPAIAALLALWAADIWLPPVPKRFTANGVAYVNVSAIIGRSLNISFGTMAVFSLPLAVLFTRHQPWPLRLASIIGLTFSLIFLNSFVAFGGCMVAGMAANVVSP